MGAGVVADVAPGLVGFGVGAGIQREYASTFEERGGDYVVATDGELVIGDPGGVSNGIGELVRGHCL